MMEKEQMDEQSSKCSSVDLQSLGKEETTPTKQRKMRRKQERICHVCGDKALGYNFNAMTCESCKAFFRRNALKSSTASCMFEGHCKIDVRTRRFCPACRLVRCLEVGMKKEMILDETERKARMRKVLANREKRKQSASDDTGLPIGSHIKEEPLSDTEVMPDQSGYSSYEGSTLAEAFNNISQSPPILANLEDFSFTQPSAAPKDSNLYRVLSPMEQTLFGELKASYSATIGEQAVERVLDESDYTSADDLVNNSEIAVRRLIKFIKRMEDFQQLCQEDQISVLKSCVMNSLLLRSAWFYSIEEDAWITPKGSISTEILKKTTGYGDLHDAHTKYCRTLKQIIKDDQAIFALLQIIIIFNPDGKGLLSRSSVSEIQDKYLVLLKHYLEAEFSYSLSGMYFANLMVKLAELKGLSDSHGRILLQVNPMQIEPLMLEVLNLH